MKIAISAESTIDLPKEMLEEFDIKVIPYTVLLGEQVGVDGEITPQDIFDYVDKTGQLPKTSAINEYHYQEFFENLLKDYDAVIHFALSSEISSSCGNCIRVGKLFENKVFVIDSKSLSTGIALQAINARKLADAGLDAKEVYEKCLARVSSVQASFVVNTLNYLYKGGRCSGLARFSAMLFRIKPQIIVKDGKMGPYKKYRGKNSAVVAQYCADTLEEFNNPDLSVAFVTHTHATQEMRDIAYKALKKRGFKKIYDTFAGATITSHCGPKTIGILYINDGGSK